MTPAELRYWQAVNRRTLRLSPDVARAILKALRSIRDALSDSELARLVSTGQIDRVFDTVLSQARFDAAFQPVRDTMRKGIVSGVKYFQREIPAKGVTITFDFLNPDVITAIRQLESRVITTLEDDVREVVRAHVENGLRDGVSSKQIARGIRDVVGLSPAQEQAVRSYRTLLETGDRGALQRALRDRRYDATLDRVLGVGVVGEKQGLSAEQIDRMVDAYRRKSIAWNAETIARTAAGDSLKLGQRLSIQSAIDAGIYDADRVEKTWVGVMDSRERPEHVAMEGETVGFDEEFSNGEMVPGDSTYNCRCIARYWQAKSQ